MCVNLLLVNYRYVACVCLRLGFYDFCEHIFVVLFCYVFLQLCRLFWMLLLLCVCLSI